MIDSIEKFLKSYEVDGTASISFDSEAGRYLLFDSKGSALVAIDAGLTRRLEHLGVLYIYAGVLEINPMAMRVLEEIKNDGKLISEESFRAEVAKSKVLYHSGDFGFELEMEAA